MLLLFKGNKRLQQAASRAYIDASASGSPHMLHRGSSGFSRSKPDKVCFQGSLRFILLLKASLHAESAALWAAREDNLVHHRAAVECDEGWVGLLQLGFRV